MSFETCLLGIIALLGTSGLFLDTRTFAWSIVEFNYLVIDRKLLMRSFHECS